MALRKLCVYICPNDASQPTDPTPYAPDFIGVLDEETYRQMLWDHKPLTDFWRIGPGTAKRLARIGITTMRGIAGADEDLLYRIFGIDAELLIDHAWGIEPTKISDIKGYKNKSHSLSRGQVLMRDYSNTEGELIVKEMTELLCHEMTEEGMVTKNVSVMVGYSNALRVPMAHGSVSFSILTDASSVIIPAVASLYRRITEPDYPVRRVFINFNDIVPREADRQMTIFDLADIEADEEGKTTGQQREEGLADQITEMQTRLKRDAALQEAVNSIRKKYGKNAMFRGMDLEEAATTLERNHQIGGHRE